MTHFCADIGKHIWTLKNPSPCFLAELVRHDIIYGQQNSVIMAEVISSSEMLSHTHTYTLTGTARAEFC